MKRFVFAVALVLSIVAVNAKAQGLQEVDIYLQAVNTLPTEISNLLVSYEKETNNYTKNQINTRICLKMNTLYLVAESFKEQTAFARAAARKDPWTFRNGVQMFQPALELFTKWCVSTGGTRISVKEAKYRAEGLAGIGMQESVGGGTAR